MSRRSKGGFIRQRIKKWKGDRSVCVLWSYESAKEPRIKKEGKKA